MGFADQLSNGDRIHENDFSGIEMRRAGDADPHDPEEAMAVQAAKKLAWSALSPIEKEEESDEETWLKKPFVPRIDRFDQKRRCCCCLGSLVSERAVLVFVATLLSLLVLVLLVLMLVSGGIVMPWLHAHANNVFVYGSLEPQPGGPFPPTAQVLYASCAWPTIPFDDLGTPPPPYLDPDTCTTGTGGSCCPIGYLRNSTSNPKLKTFEYCASSESPCPNDFVAKNCVSLLANKSRIVTDVPYRGLLVQPNVSSADWSWILLFLLTPLAILLFLAEVSYLVWELFRSKHIELALRPEPTLVDCTTPTPEESETLAELREVARSYHNRFNRGCCGAMIVGILMAALLLTGGLSGIFASSPDIDDANSFSSCFVDPTPQTKELLDPLTTWYTTLVLSTSFGALTFVFVLFTHAALMFPQVYNTLWRWDTWLFITVLVSFLVGISLLTNLMKELLS